MLDPLSEKKLARVKPDLVAVVRRAAEISSRAFSIVQGNRTQAEQNALYAQGRTTKGNIVTWTKNSKHLGGGAVDFAALVNGKISWNDKLYAPIVDAFKEAARELKVGIEAGIDWKTKDYGHIQLSPKNPTPKNPSAGIGWTITDVQNALVKHGQDPGVIDGIMGKKTRAALTRFQKAQGLPQTGSPDKATTDALARPVGAAPPVELLETDPQATLVGAADWNRDHQIAETKVAGTPTEVGSPRWTVDRLQAHGIPQLDAIALTANLMWESGGHGSINWSAVGDGGHSLGAGQWSDRHGRFDGLKTVAKDLGTTWHDPEAQLQFLVNELKTTEYAARRRMRAATTLPEKMTAALTYWRPGIPHADKRLAIAEKLNREIEDV